MKKLPQKNNINEEKIQIKQEKSKKKSFSLHIRKSIKNDFLKTPVKEPNYGTETQKSFKNLSQILKDHSYKPKSKEISSSETKKLPKIVLPSIASRSKHSNSQHSKPIKTLKT